MPIIGEKKNLYIKCPYGWQHVDPIFNKSSHSWIPADWIGLMQINVYIENIKPLKPVFLNRWVATHFWVANTYLWVAKTFAIVLL